MDIPLWFLKRLIHWLPYKYFRIFSYHYDIDPKTYRGSLFEPLLISTATINLNVPDLTNLEKIDHIKNFEPTEEIPRISSNFCNTILPAYYALKNKPKSNRGRKAKTNKNKKKRRKQGNGSEFNSQMTFDVKSPVLNGKYYIIKIFRKGSIQIPGSIALRFDDIDEPLRILSKYISKYIDQPIDLSNYTNKRVAMVNFGAPLSDDDYIINEDKLGELLNLDGEARELMVIRDVKYINHKGNGTKLKLSRPTKTNPKRDTTVKVSAAKAEFDGGISFEDTKRTYWWLNDYIIKHFDEVMIYKKSNKYLHKMQENNNASIENWQDYDDSESSDTEDESYVQQKQALESTEDWLNKNPIDVVVE